MPYEVARRGYKRINVKDDLYLKDGGYRAGKAERLKELPSLYSSKRLEEIGSGLTHQDAAPSAGASQAWAPDPYRNESPVSEASHAYREQVIRHEVSTAIQRRGVCS